MIDIHCHILHGLDDGSDNFEESVMMAQMAHSSGTRMIVATPHCNVPRSFKNQWSADIAKKIVDLNERLASEGTDIKILPGNEIFACGDFLQQLKDGKLITLNNSVYPLVEFDFYEHPKTVFQKLEQLVAEGYVPIVAHPERYEFVQYEEDAAKYIKKIGCLIQLNKGSVMGKFGRSAQHAAHAILDAHLVDIVASDAHSPYVRTPRLENAHEMIGEIYSYDYAQLLLCDNPLKVIQNRKIQGEK